MKLPRCNGGSRDSLCLGVNGYESVEDAISSGISLSKDGAQSLATAVKEVRENPEEAIESAKLKISKAIEDGKSGIFHVRDVAVDTYEHRNVILNNVGDQIEYVVNNPGEVTKKAKQHGTELYKGIVRGSIGSLKDMTGHLQVGREDFKKLELVLEQQAAEFVSLKATEDQVNLLPANEHNILDSVLVGGDVFHEALSRQIPSDILNAYALQYPGLADQDSFREHLLSLSDDSRKSFVAAIKGKLFEVQYVDYLNQGHLEDGYTAVLAGLANQPGFDIEIHGPDGDICRLIQAKATDSISYVKQALDRYPDIKVVTTSEVHSELVLRGMSENVIDGNTSQQNVSASPSHIFLSSTVSILCH